MAKSKAPKPSQVWVEVDSDEESGASRLNGAARGLNAKNVISSTATATSANPSTAASTAPFRGGGRHVTRAARSGGRPAVNYDQKYHPMDLVTRPNSAAVRRHSGSVSNPTIGLDEDESEASSPDLSGSSQDEDEDEDELASDSPVHHTRTVLTKRQPDPRASRHSSRAEAQKPISYSRKYHPQDWGLPGHRRSAIMPPPRPFHTGRKRKALDKVIIPDSDEDDEDAIESIPARMSDAQDEAEADMRIGSPSRRPLQSIDLNSRPTKRQRRRERGSKSPQVISSTHISSMGTDEVFQLVVNTLNEDNDNYANGGDANALKGGASDKSESDALEHRLPLPNLPAYIMDRFAGRKGGINTSTALSLMLEDYRFNHHAELLVVKPYLAVSEYIMSDTAGGQHTSRLKNGRADESAFDESSRTMSEQRDISRSPSEQCDIEVGQPASHFDEAMAITEAVNAEITHGGSDGEAAEQIPPVEEEIAVTVIERAEEAQPSDNPDPIDLLPKLSSHPTTASFPSTADPDSDCSDSEAVDAPESAISLEL